MRPARLRERTSPRSAGCCPRSSWHAPVSTMGGLTRRSSLRRPSRAPVRSLMNLAHYWTKEVKATTMSALDTHLAQLSRCYAETSKGDTIAKRSRCDRCDGRRVHRDRQDDGRAPRRTRQGAASVVHTESSTGGVTVISVLVLNL
jgi:hypothetical protein